MKRIILFTALIGLYCIANAQNRIDTWYVNGGLGAINYFGDLQEKVITPTSAGINGSVGLTYQRTPHIAGNFSFMVGQIAASDSKNGDKWFYRNLSFKSLVFEAAVTAEYDLIDIDQPDDDAIADKNPAKITPYVFGGIGLLHFNPYTYDLSGEKVFLQPLGTEAEKTPYSLWTVTLPVGIGVKYALNNKMMLGVEFNLRKTLSDYLDDVSQHTFVDTVQLAASHGQEAASLSYRADEIPDNKYQFYGYRGNPDKKDGYYSFVIKFSYQLFTHKSLFYYGY